jgi:hypothetical protein
MFATVLLIVAVILFLLAAFNVSSPVSLGWIGMACFAGSFLSHLVR